jgi:Holliday junction resolvasome RuvABC endonuclease subunit
VIVLGIDQSYNSSGIIVLEGDTIIHSECFKSNKNFDRFGQAYEVATHIADLLDIYKPDIVAIEGLAFGMRGNVTRDLGGLQFVIVAHLQEVKKQPVKIVAPLTVKKFATGSGKAKKEQMIESLPEYALDNFLLLGVKKTTGLADLADAYWIAKVAENT